MKRQIAIIGFTLILGLVLGYFIFGNAKTDTLENTEHIHQAKATTQLWTCSMHPQITQNEPGNCPICGMALTPISTSDEGLAPEQFKMTNNALKLANIQTLKVGENSSEEGNLIELSGKMAVNEEAMAIQSSYFEGRIERLYVNYKEQEVKKGQLLATLYSPELIAAQQELLTAGKYKSSQSQLYDAVKNKLKLWKLSDTQIQSIENSGTILEQVPIYATVQGKVLEIMSAEGDFLKRGQPMAKLVNLNTVWANFDVYENQLTKIHIGQKIQVRPHAYPDKILEGIITFIDPILKNATRTVTVRAELNNKEEWFKPGMFVSGRIKNQNKNSKGYFSIPASAVLWTGKRSIVYVKVITDEPVFEIREVELGTPTAEQIEVISGLELGEEIVINGTFTVDAAAQIQGKKSMMNTSKGNLMTSNRDHLNPVNQKSDGNEKAEFSDEFKAVFNNVLEIYYKLKDAFVLSDQEQTIEAAKKVLKVMRSGDTMKLTSAEKMQLSALVIEIENILNKNNLEAQRDHFVQLNKQMVAIATQLKTLQNTVFIQQCPMANNNKGAFWLSAEKNIRNPYFGSMMLTCGSVVKTL